MPALATSPAATHDERQRLSFQRDPAAGYEPSLLREPQTRAWAGFRIGIFEAQTTELRGQVGEHAALGMILRGRTRARILSRGQDCDFSPGRDSVGVFAPKFEVDWTRWDCEAGAQRMMVELDLADLARAGDLDAMLPSRRVLRQDLTLSDRNLATLMRLMADEVRAGSPHGALYATSLSLALASYVFAHHAEGAAPSPRERGGLSDAQKTRVLALIHERLADPLGLDELATAAGVSRFHFLRLFKNSFGVTPHRFVMDQRIAAARHLLDETALPLAQIAATTGFSSQSHLCTAMRRQLGSTPGQWRRRSGG
ncbi:MAG TPA: AraC family transcriptional regulator [Aquabacterium sp.]|nr:AraC family transcriptional regulator [Aquabacterium sp.]